MEENLEQETPAAEVTEEPVDDMGGDLIDDESTEPAEDADSGLHGEDDATDEHTKKGGVQKRIDKLTADKYAERQAREEEAAARKAAEERAAQLQARLEEIEAMRPAPKKETPGKPKVDDFEDYDDFVEALTDWKANATIEQRLAAQQQQSVEAQRRMVLEAKLEIGRGKYKDFDKVVRSENVPFTNEILDVAASADNTADILYALAKHPSEVARLASLSPISMAVAIGKIDAKMSNRSPMTKAPAPINPISGGGGKTPSVYDDDISYEEYVRMRRESEKNRR